LLNRSAVDQVLPSLFDQLFRGFQGRSCAGIVVVHECDPGESDDENVIDDAAVLFAMADSSGS